MAQLGKGLLVRLLGVAVAIIVVVGVVLVLNKGTEQDAAATAPDVGSCLAMSGSRSDAQHDEVDCDAADAAYEIVADDGACDESAEVAYAITTTGDDRGTTADLCLALNANKGDCFTGWNATNFLTKVVCEEAARDAGAQKVVTVGAADDQCVTGTQPLKNATRDTLLCLGPTA